MTEPELPICAKLRKFDWHVHTSQGSKPTSIPTEAADTIEALVKVVEAVPCECDYDHSCHRCRALTRAREGVTHDKE